MLAEIEAPEVDQQFRQAQADLATAQANYILAHNTDLRWQALVKKARYLSKTPKRRQAMPTQRRRSSTRRRPTPSACARCNRSSVWLRRSTASSRGATPTSASLINAGQATGAELFRVADPSKLRIYVFVPQAYAASASPSTLAELRFAEHPGKVYRAQIVRTAHAIDPASRTLQVELEVDNASGELLPGAYVEVHLKMPSAPDSLRIPSLR